MWDPGGRITARLRVWPRRAGVRRSPRSMLLTGARRAGRQAPQNPGLVERERQPREAHEDHDGRGEPPPGNETGTHRMSTRSIGPPGGRERLMRGSPRRLDCLVQELGILTPEGVGVHGGSDRRLRSLTDRDKLVDRTDAGEHPDVAVTISTIVVGNDRRRPPRGRANRDQFVDPPDPGEYVDVARGIIVVGSDRRPRRPAHRYQLVHRPDARKEPDVVLATLQICPACPVRATAAFVRAVDHASSRDGAPCRPTAKLCWYGDCIQFGLNWRQ